MGDLLAGLSDVKLKKASDHSLPGMDLQLPSMTSVLKLMENSQIKRTNPIPIIVDSHSLL